MDKSAYLYMLSNKKNGTIYTGATTNLVERVYTHKIKIIKKSFTAKYNLTRLIYFEVYEDLASAFSREKQLKGWKRDWKIALIVKDNPDWLDLYSSII